MEINQKIEKIIKISSFCCIFVLIMAIFLYSQTSNKSVSSDKPIKLADVSCMVTSGPNTVYDYDGAFPNNTVGSCSRDYKKNGDCYEKGATVDTSKCGYDDGLDCYAYRKYHVECSGCGVANCQTCVSGSTTKCSVCNSGYIVLDGYNCTKVSAPCCVNGTTTQTSTALCENAAKNGTLTHMGSCASTCTVDHCQTCSSSDNTVCTTCENGYKLTGTGKCQLDAITCSVPYCQTCVSGSSTKCSVCASGYHVVTDGTCTKDSTTCTVANCKTCVSGSTTKCSVCNTGYTLTSTGTCSTNSTTCTVANCKTCVSGSTTKCSVCNTGYTLTSTGTCSTNSTTCTAANCKTCVSGSTTKCSVCNSGYHIVNNNCVQDVTSCPEGMGADSSATTGCSRCAAGYYSGANSNICSPCAAGKWSYAGSGSCTLKCEEGYACKNGTKTKCSVATPEGSGECYTCDVDNCKTCEKYKKDVCATCKSGYSLNGKGKCYWTGGSSTPKDACYKNTTTNEYIWGQYDGQVGYSKLVNDQSTCNKILIKLVDDSGYDLLGAIITVTSSLNPTSPTNYNIGKKELELLAPGTYKIKETAAPTNYQIDSYEIEVTVDSLGIVNVKTTSSNVDLGTTNNTRNTTITWKNLAVASTNPPVDDDDEEKCYVKHDDDTENEYCYGKKDDCSSYTDVLEGRDNKSCKEDVACYTDSTGAYVSGKYTNRDGYKYYAASCPKCYKNQNGELTWGSFEDVEGFTLEPNIAKDKCKTKANTSSSGNSKLIYIILIILIIAAIIFVALKGKPTNNSKKDDEDDTEEDNYNYNYRV